MALQSAWTETRIPSVTVMPWAAAPPLGMRAIPEPSFSDVILGGGSGGWHGFAPLPSNFAAFEAAMRVAQGSSSYAVIVGPSGWGKSHLLQVAAERAAVRCGGECQIHSPTSFLALPSSNVNPMPLFVDGVQDILRLPRLRHRFMVRLRERTRLRRPTLLALEADGSTKLVRELASLRVERSVFHIAIPSPEERELIVANVGLSMDMKLHRTLARVIGRHVDGNGRSMLGALNRLALYDNDWSSESKLTKALGITLPFLTGCDGWDIRDAVQEAVSLALPTPGSAAALSAWLCWSMRRLLRMPEDQVAAFLGLPPGEIYRLTEEARSWKDEATKARIKQMLIKVLAD